MDLLGEGEEGLQSEEKAGHVREGSHMISNSRVQNLELGTPKIIGNVDQRVGYRVRRCLDLFGGHVISHKWL